jgi:ketosteroid isomerase-like protein
MPSNDSADQPTDVVRRLFACYLEQDRVGAEKLIGDEFSFTSPQDDHIDRARYFATCFPTASRVRRQEILRLAATGADVFVMYEYELQTGAVHRNAEVLTVRDGRVVEVQVFFGGSY